jgi:hypothetical protein
VARCKDASAANFPIAVSVARCKDATNPICSIAVFVAGCKDATLAIFESMFLLPAARTQLPPIFR